MHQPAGGLNCGKTFGPLPDLRGSLLGKTKLSARHQRLSFHVGCSCHGSTMRVHWFKRTNQCFRTYPLSNSFWGDRRYNRGEIESWLADLAIAFHQRCSLQIYKETNHAAIFPNLTSFSLSNRGLLVSRSSLTRLLCSWFRNVLSVLPQHGEP